MLLARCVDSPGDFLAITCDEMAGNVAKSHLDMFKQRRRFVAQMFSCRLFVRLSFRLLYTRLAVHCFTFHSVLWSLKISKPQRERQRAQLLCGVR